MSITRKFCHRREDQISSQSTQISQPLLLENDYPTRNWLHRRVRWDITYLRDKIFSKIQSKTCQFIRHCLSQPHLRHHQYWYSTRLHRIIVHHGIAIVSQLYHYSITIVKKVILNYSPLILNMRSFFIWGYNWFV